MSTYNNRNPWAKAMNDLADYDEQLDQYKQYIDNKVGVMSQGPANKPVYDFEFMLRQVMLYLRESGHDVFPILKDNDLNAWWSKELAKIKRHEEREAAKARALEVLSEAERAALGLKF